MDTRHLIVDGVELSLAEAGPGQARRGMLLHGVAGAYDQRGHGDSAHPDGEEEFSLHILENDLRAVADRLGWDRFVLLGHSMGGMVAQLVALSSPQRLAGLVLMDTSHGPPG